MRRKDLKTMVGQVKCFLIFGACIFMLAVAGCAGPGTEIQARSAQSQNDPSWPGNKYSPKYPSGIDTLDAAKRDLSAVLRTKAPDDFAGVRFFGELDFNRPDNQKNLTEYLKHVQLYMLVHDASGKFKYMLPRGGITVLEDRISVNPVYTLFYTDLVDSQITVESRDEEIRFSWPDVNWQLVNESLVGKSLANQWRPVYQRPYMIQCGSLISFFLKDKTDAQRFADDLFFIQQNLAKHNRERLALFETKATQYRALKVKPPISEEQRRYIVQANALNERKDHAGAIDMYIKAVEVDPVAYPAAYFNLALLSAQMQRFEPAIAYMKQYLLLEPEAKDARSAQDKIYEWELMLKK